VSTQRAEARIDVTAIAANMAELCRRAGAADVMAVVKADAYGHGLIPCARAAVAGGASWLGTALLSEALDLRAAGVTGPRVLAWLLDADDRWADGVAADVELSVSAPWAVAAAVDGARTAGRPARLHLKLDSGLGRGGSTPADWAQLVDAARAAEADGTVVVTGLWSHLAFADVPGHSTTDLQLAAFQDAIAVAESAGLRPEVRHLANSAAALTRPDTRFDLVRTGLPVYGLSPIPDQATPADLGLRPVMTLAARLALVKQIPGGQGVSYLHRYTTSADTTLGLVPLGYADGIPRAATNVGPLLAGGARRTVAGTVCMDQFVVDLGPGSAAAVGDEVLLFGPGDAGEPTVQDWADALGTIAYEITTRLGPRVPRVFLGASGSRREG